MTQITEVLKYIRKKSKETVMYHHDHGLFNKKKYLMGFVHRKIYFDEVYNFCEYLKLFGYDSCLFGGMALGYQRNKQIMPWDDDIDIVIDFGNKQTMG